jgi:hypothetical protein
MINCMYKLGGNRQQCFDQEEESLRNLTYEHL